MNSPSPSSPTKNQVFDLRKPKRPLAQAESMLEFAVLLLSRHLALEPRQVLSLLADDCLYFGHLAVKGKRNSFVELVEALTELRNRLPQVASLCCETIELEFLLQLLKPCLLSRSKQLPKLAITILRQLEPLLEGEIYSMLTKSNGIISAWCLAVKRHSELLKPMFEQLLALAGQRYNSLLLADLRGLSSNECEYLHLLSSLLPLIDRTKFVQEECLVGLLNICEVMFQRESTDLSFAVMQLQYEITELFSKEIMEIEFCLPVMLDLLKKAMRKSSFIVKQAAIVHSFCLLEKLALAKNAHSGVLFKRMIFSMLEHHSDIQLRHAIASGMQTILDKFSNVPVDQLALPLVKQLQTAEDVTYVINVFDMELLRSIVGHPRLSAGCGAILLEYLIALTLKNISVTAGLVQIIEKILNRFSGESELLERLLTQAQVLLELIKMLMKPSRPVNSISTKLKVYKKQTATRLLGMFIQLQLPQINQRCQQALSVLYRQAEDQRGNPDPDLYRLLTTLGVPEVVAKESSVQSSQIALNRALLETEDSRLDRPAIRERRRQVNRELEQSLLERERKIKDEIERSKQKFIELSTRKKRQQEILKGAYKLPGRSKSFSLPLVGGNSELQVSIASSNQQEIPVGSLLRPFNSVKESYVISKWQPMNLAEEEERDQLSMEVYTKKHVKFIKELFVHYSNISQSHSKPVPDTGNEIERPPAMISFVDCIRMLREENSSRLSKPIINEIIIVLNSFGGKVKNPLSGVTQEGLQPFLQQFLHALEIHDRRQQLQNSVPLGIKFQALLKSIHAADPILRFNEHEEDAQTQQLTKKMQQNPELEIPTNCRRIEEEDVEVNFGFSENIKKTSKIGMAYLECYEVLSEILKASKLSISLLQPYSAITKQAKVVLKERPFKRIDLVQHKSSLLNPSKSSTVQNDFLRKLREKEQFLEKVSMDKEVKRRQHLRNLKESLQTLRVRKKQQSEEKLAQQQQARSAHIQKKQLLWNSYHEEQKKVLEEHKTRKEEKQQEEKEQKQSEQEQKKSRAKRFVSQQNSKIKEQLALSQQKARAKKEQAAKKEQEEKRCKLQIEHKLKKVQAQSIQQRDQLEERNLAVRDFFESKLMKYDLEQYIKPLEKMFAYYHNKYSEYRIETAREQWLTLKGFTHLIGDFEICPKLLQLKEALQLFKGLIKEKEKLGEASLNYQQTLELLGRLAMYSAKVLQRMELQRKSNEKAANKGYQNQFEQEQIKGSLLNDDKDEVDNSKLVPVVVRHLLDYMNLGSKIAKLERNYT